jgi:hypothetical protein
MTPSVPVSRPQPLPPPGRLWGRKRSQSRGWSWISEPCGRSVCVASQRRLDLLERPSGECRSLPNARPPLPPAPSPKAIILPNASAGTELGRERCLAPQPQGVGGLAAPSSLRPPAMDRSSEPETLVDRVQKWRDPSPPGFTVQVMMCFDHVWPESSRPSRCHAASDSKLQSPVIRNHVPPPSYQAPHATVSSCTVSSSSSLPTISSSSSSTGSRVSGLSSSVIDQL